MSEPALVLPDHGRLATATRRVATSLASILEPASELGARAAAAVAELVATGRLEREDVAAVDALVECTGLTEHEFDLVVLASLADAHEAFATGLRLLHPEHQPYPTVGLAMRTIPAYDVDRSLLRRELCNGGPPVAGLVSVTTDGPFPERTLRPVPAMWSALVGVDEWPTPVVCDRRRPSAAGLQRVIERDTHAPLGRILGSTNPWNVLVRSGDPPAAADRVALLLQRLGVPWVVLHISEPSPADVLHLSLHAIARGQAPIVVVAGDGVVDLGRRSPALGPLVVCTDQTTDVAPGHLPFHELRFDRLDPLDRREMWEQLAGGPGEEVAGVAGPWVDTALAQRAMGDARAVAALDGRFPEPAEILDGLRARSRRQLPAAVRIVTPSATRDDLVVDTAVERALDHAVARVRHQTRVHDQWGLVADRRGGAGVRVMLAGPPGTGKTLAAEVMACQLGVELLVVDLAQVVSKWLGETEKNLASVFDTAERSQAVLVFDEADALFARRTEVNDSRDRYANLETAYLLTRLERFEGLTVLTTNQRPQIDPAFIRRLDIVVDMPEPDNEQRHRLWSVHLPATAPVSDDVDLVELADRYPLAGGVIRNAALSAAFAAARIGGSIDRRTLIDAIEHECLKAGRPFAGRPHDIAQPAGPIN